VKLVVVPHVDDIVYVPYMQVIILLYWFIYVAPRGIGYDCLYWWFFVMTDHVWYSGRVECSMG